MTSMTTTLTISWIYILLVEFRRNKCKTADISEFRNFQYKKKWVIQNFCFWQITHSRKVFSHYSKHKFELCKKFVLSKLKIKPRLIFLKANISKLNMWNTNFESNVKKRYISNDQNSEYKNGQNSWKAVFFSFVV